MGFGFLVIGYFLFSILSYNSFGYAFMLVGSYMMFMGLLTLRKYSKKYIPALCVSVFMILVSLYETISGVGELLSLNLPALFSTDSTVISYIELAEKVAFHGCLLYAIYQMCVQLDVPKGKAGAIRNMIFAFMFYLLTLISVIPTPFQEKYIQMFALPVLLCMFALYISMILMLITCYAQICPEGEEDMHRKPSRFAWVNKLREKEEEQENRAVESTKAYLEERRAKALKKKEEKANRKK